MKLRILVNQAEDIYYLLSELNSKFILQVLEHPLLDKLIFSVQKIDFGLEYYKNDEIRYKSVIDLRNQLKSGTIHKLRIQIQRELDSYEPDLEGKLEMVIEDMILTSQRIGLEIGYESYPYYNSGGQIIILEQNEIECLVSVISFCSGLSKEDSFKKENVRILVDLFEDISNDSRVNESISI